MMKSRPLMHCGLAFAALAIGALIYLLDRPAGSAQFIPEALQLGGGGAASLGRLGGNLPSFLHIYAFILLTVSVLRPGIGTLTAVCGAWLCLELWFEVHLSFGPDRWLAALGLPFGSAAGGVFDPMDVAALVLGMAAAFLTVISTTRRTER